MLFTPSPRFYHRGMDFAVLGPLRVTGLHGPVELGGLKERTLLAHLVAHVGEVVGSEQLIDSLWPVDPPRTAAKSLQTYVLRLRNALEPGRGASPQLIITEGAGYRLAVDPQSVDAHRFIRLAALGRRALAEGRAEAAAATLREALGMWRGPAYAGFEQTAFGEAEARRLEELRLLSLEDRVSAELDLGRAPELAAELEALVHRHPLRERAWCLLVTALFRAGRQADALAACARARGVLAEELGIDPGPELRALQARVLAQDPTLRGPRRGDAVPPALLRRPGPFVGRPAELAALRDGWARVVRGTPVILALRGPPGSGRTRLAAEFAAEVAQHGAVVEYGEEVPTSPPAAPTLNVVTRPVVHLPDGAARLVVVLASPGTPVPPGAEVIDLGPLPSDAVRELVASYVDPADVDEATAYVLRESGGWPARIQDESLAWARRRAAERVDVAASRTGLARADLAAVRAELADTVADLREVDLRAEPPEPDRCPWRGLAAYEVSDAPWFAGRERLIAELVARMAGSRLVGVVGASGSGKSSLVRAGLLAALASGSLPGSDGWTQLVMRPGEHPMRALAVAALSGGGRGHADDLLDWFMRDENAPTRTVLVVDQLEEVWTACADPGERATFLDTLAELVAGAAELSVVLVVRADYVGELADHAALARMMSDAAVLVGAPREAEVRRAIELPAARAQLLLDVGLVDALVADAGAEPGSLPLLSTALTRLWERRDGRRLTLAAYVSGGGLSGAIAALAEGAYTTLASDEDREATRILFLRLAGPGVGQGVTRRRVPLAELAALPDPRVRGVVDTLAAARMLTVSEGHVEVAHEALFREWPRLQSWLAEDVVGRTVARRLALAAAEWDAEGREVGALWRGARLAAGLEFAAGHPDELTPTEHEFLAAGRERLEAERLDAESRAATTARQNRRLRRLLGGVGLLLVMALVAGVLAVQARSQEEAAKVSADARRLAATALTEDYLDRALLDAVEGVREERSPQTVGALLSALARSPAALLQVRTQDRFLQLVGTPDGSTYYATVNNGEVWAIDGRSGAASVWHRYPAPAGVVMSPRADLLAVGWANDGHGAVEVYRRADGTQVSRFVSDQLMGGAAWSPDGKALYLVSADALLVVDPASGTLVRRVAWPHAPPVFSEPVSLPDGRVVVALGGLDARVVDPRTGKIRTLGIGPGLRVSPDGRLLAGSRRDAPVLLDVRTLREVRRFPQGGTDVFAFSRDGRHLATGGVNETVRVWNLGDPPSSQPAEEWAGHSGKVMAAVFAPDGRTLWTAGRDGAIVAWDVEGSRRLATPGRVDPQGFAGSLTPDGRTAAVIYDPGPDRMNPARVWNVDTKQAITGFLPGLKGRPGWSTAAVALTADRRTALTGLAPFGDPPREEGVVLVHDLPSGAVRHTVELPFAVVGLDVTPDGRIGIVNGTSGIAFIDLIAGRLVDDPLRRPLYFTGIPGRNVAVSPDGRWAAVARADAVELLDLRSRRTVRSWRGPDLNNVSAMVWSPDGRTLAYGGGNGRVGFRSMPDGTELGPSRLVFPGFTLALTASPDGRWLAGLGTDGELALFDLTSRELVGRPLPPPHPGGWGFPAWSSDSRAVTVWYESGDTVRWEVDADRWIDRACRVAHRDLTADEWRLLRPGVPWRATCGPRALEPLPH